MPTKRPATLVDLRSLARTHTEMAIRTLAGVAASKRVDPKVRIEAADMLLDRGWGKASTQGGDAGEIRVVIRQIVERASDAQIIDAEPIEHDRITQTDG